MLSTVKHAHGSAASRADTKTILAVDIGGTSMRFRLLSPGKKPSRLAVLPTPNRASLPRRPLEEIQDSLRRAVESTVTSLLERGRADAVGVSFAGPIDARGNIVGAPTVWGSGSAAFPLGRHLESRTGLPCFVINDVSAAAWRFSTTEPGSFSVITVSSGVGNKVFHRNAVLVNDAGYGGELGHCTAVGFDREFRCECGGINHIGAISSGRGVMNLLKAEMDDDRSGFRRSLLGRNVSGAEAVPTPEAFVAAVHRGDAFARSVLRNSTRPIAHAIASLYALTGIERTIIIGGFANALGSAYKAALVHALKRFDFFGRSAPPQRMITVSPTGDLDCLTGAALYARHRLQEC